MTPNSSQKNILGVQHVEMRDVLNWVFVNPPDPQKLGKTPPAQNVNIAAVFARALDAAEKQDFNKNSVVFPLFPNVFRKFSFIFTFFPIF